MTQPLTPEREAEIRAHVSGMRNFSIGNLAARDLLAELDRLRTLLAGREDDLRFLRETAIPELRRKWESEEDGKKRWRERAETAEAGLVKVAEFVAARAEYITSINACHPDNLHDYYRWQGHAESRRQLAQTLGLPVAWPAETEATS